MLHTCRHVHTWRGLDPDVPTCRQARGARPSPAQLGLLQAPAPPPLAALPAVATYTATRPPQYTREIKRYRRYECTCATKCHWKTKQAATKHTAQMPGATSGIRGGRWRRCRAHVAAHGAPLPHLLPLGAAAHRAAAHRAAAPRCAARPTTPRTRGHALLVLTSFCQWSMAAARAEGWHHCCCHLPLLSLPCAPQAPAPAAASPRFSISRHALRRVGSHPLRLRWGTPGLSSSRA